MCKKSGSKGSTHYILYIITRGKIAAFEIGRDCDTMGLQMHPSKGVAVKL